MAKPFVVFYSWQSDLPNSTNRGVIQGELEAIAKELSAEGVVLIEVDRDTSGVAGSPDIGKTILDKIDAADAFVGDVSIINSDAAAERKTPNPNVVFELGWAMKSLGTARVVMVMNTNYGGPEQLPFDLKQRRTVKYELPPGEDKSAAKKALRDQLRAAIKAIVEERGKEQAASPPADRAAAAIDAIRGGRASQDMEAKSFMRKLAEDLDKLDPHELAGDQADNLIKAIEASRSIVDDFGRVAQLAAAEKSQDAVHGLVQGFEYFLERYQLRGGGTWRESDFDLFKFVGHELAVVLVGHLIRAERWSLVASVLAEEIHRNVSGEDRVARIGRVSSHSRLLANRARETGRYSVHADLLKARHDGDAPAGGLPMDDVLAADLMLFLGLHEPGSDFPGWYPRSAAYMEGRAPRFLSVSTSQGGAKNLAAAIAKSNLAEMKAHVTGALADFKRAVSSESIHPHWSFDPAKISTG